MLPSRLPRNTHDQFDATAFQLDFPSRRASGNSAKLPVTSSSPSSTIITRPTGNIIAPTSGCPVVTAAAEGEAGGGAEQRAGQRAADQEVARRQRQFLQAGIDHRGDDVGGFCVIHHEAPIATRPRGYNERKGCDARKPARKGSAASEDFRAIRSASLLRRSSLDDGQRASTAADIHTHSNRVPLQQFSKNHCKIKWIYRDTKACNE